MDRERHRMANERKWDGWASTFDGEGWRSRYLRRAQRKLIDILDTGGGQTVLDVGCGTGWALGEIANVNAGAGTYYGVDLSEKMIGKAREIFAGRENFRFIRADAESIPLDGDVADTIICTNSFHHYYDPGKALAEMHRLLKRGGYLYILDPTADSWFERLINRVAGLFDTAHVKMYSTAEFTSLYRGAGLAYVGNKTISSHQKIHIGEKQDS